MNSDDFKQFAAEAQRIQTYTTPVVKPDAHEKKEDKTREHALNWGLGTAIISACFLIAVWVLAKMLWDLPLKTLFLTVLIAALMGGANGAWKLIRFTEEHRDYLYAVEELTQVDINHDGVIGQPKEHTETGTFLRGADGASHQVSVRLSSEEVWELKKHLLETGKYTVRAVNNLLGDETRASALRLDLFTIGILETPKDRAATKVTEAGKRALMRWA